MPDPLFINAYINNINITLRNKVNDEKKKSKSILQKILYIISMNEIKRF